MAENTIKDASNRGNKVTDLFFDLPKAFSIVDHDTLQHVFDYGIRGLICDWFSHYSCNHR